MSKILVITFFLSSRVVCSAPFPNAHIQVRGGRSSPLELNPNYIAPPTKQPPVRPVTLGDLEREGYDRGNLWTNPPTVDYDVYRSESSRMSLTDAIVGFVKRTHQLSPTLSFVSLVCIAVYVLWQIPASRDILSRHFVCNRENLRRRPQSVFLSSVSHASFMHLLVNMVAYLSLGPPLRQTLRMTNWPLWPLVIGAALSGSAMFLAMEGGGGCIGLSAVTVAFLAVRAKLFPEKPLGLVLAVFPIQLPGHVALKLLLVVSVLGSLNRNSGVAHLSHLGGLLFGMAYYEAWLRRHQIRQLSWRLKKLIPGRK